MTVMYEGVYAGCWTAARINTNCLVNRPLFQNKLAECATCIFMMVMMALVVFMSLLLSVSAMIH